MSEPMNDRLSELQDVATSADAAYSRMLQSGKGIGALPDAEREAIGEHNFEFGADKGRRVALLVDVARAARDFLDRPPPTRRDDLVDALFRLDADLMGDDDE